MARGSRGARDSVSAETSKFKVINNTIHPTLTLSDAGITYFQSIINSRERDTWTRHDIHLASQLGLLQTEIDNVQQRLDAEGALIYDRFDAPREHPSVGTRSRLYTMQNILVKQLGLSASNRQLGDKSQLSRNKHEGEMRDIAEKADSSDGILA